MAKNKMTDLTDHLFMALERLNEEDLSPEQIEQEVKKAEAISGIASQIIQANKVTVDAMRLVAGGNISFNELPESFGIKKISSQ